MTDYRQTQLLDGCSLQRNMKVLINQRPQRPLKRPLLLSIACLVLLCAGLLPQARAVDASGVYEYSEVDVRPTPKKQVRIHFPLSVRKKGESPEIVLRFVVTKDGDVAKITVVKFSHPDMINPAIDAYEAAKFNPGKKDGQPVDTRMEVTELYPSR